MQLSQRRGSNQRGSWRQRLGFRFRLLMMTCATLGAAGLLVPKAMAAEVTNLEAPGNLQSTHKVGCVSLDKVSERWTPADIYPGVGKCIVSGKYHKAAALFALAGVYGRVDIDRVSDKSAHDAILVLERKVFANLSKVRRVRFLGTVRELAKSSRRLKRLCNAVQKVGPPDYVPTYMIQHGMGAFVGEKTKGGLVPNFDMKRAWHQAVRQYLHCSK